MEGNRRLVLSVDYALVLPVLTPMPWASKIPRWIYVWGCGDVHQTETMVMAVQMVKMEQMLTMVTTEQMAKMEMIEKMGKTALIERMEKMEVTWRMAKMETTDPMEKSAQ